MELFDVIYRVLEVFAYCFMWGSFLGLFLGVMFKVAHKKF